MKDKSKKPIFVDLSVGETKCNMKCIYCMPNGSIDNSIDVDISDVDDFATNSKKLIDKIALLGVNYLKLSGGEITIHGNYAKEVLQYASNKFTLVQLLTNGTIWNSSDLDWWLKFGNTQIQFSLDGITTNANKPRGLSKFRLSNIQTSLDWLASNSYPCEINCVITRFNAAHIPSFLDYVHANWPLAIVFPFPVHGYPEYSASEDDLTPFFNYYFNDGRWSEILPPFEYMRLLRDYYSGGRINGTICHVPAFGRGIIDSGSIAMCPCHGIKNVGNILNDDETLLAKSVDNTECNLIGQCLSPYYIINLIHMGLVSNDELKRLLFIGQMAKYIRQKTDFQKM